MVPEELGRYRIIRHIGDNALGAAYLGSDPLLKRTVTLQTTQLDLAAFEQDGFAEQFLQKIKAVERLNHPNIAAVHDSAREGDMAYIATEHHEGRDLRELIVKGKPTPAELAVELVAGVADGLAYAHRRGIVHQNIDPSHITVLPNGGIKLSGFGIAALHSGSKHPDAAFQSAPAYLAPEQFSGKPVDGRTDLFSLGIIFYQLLTGRAPFEGDTAAEVMYRIVRKPARRPSRVVRLEHKGFDVILAKALAKSPDNRYQTAADFAADLRRARDLASEKLLPWPTGGLAPRKPLSGGEGEDDHDGAGSHARMPTSRRWAYAAMGLVLAGGIAVFSLTGDKATETPETPTTQTAEVPAPPEAADTTPAPTPQPPPSPPEESTPVISPPAAPETPVTPIPPEPIKPATVTFAVTPWGEVFVNNKSKGISPPLTRLELPPGRVRIEIRNTGAPPVIKEIDLAEGKTVRLKHKF